MIARDNGKLDQELLALKSIYHCNNVVAINNGLTNENSLALTSNLAFMIYPIDDSST
jgi:hypothetical protein